MIVPRKNVNEVRETLRNVKINGDRLGYNVIYRWKDEKKNE